MTNVGIDASQGFIHENGFVAFRVYESLAGVDLNDGTDSVDFVIQKNKGLAGVGNTWVFGIKSSEFGPVEVSK